MAKKSRSSDTKSSGKTRRKQLWVVSSDGRRQRFLRGVITHYLAERGLEFDDAYAIAQTLRAELSDRSEITKVELRELMRAHLEAELGPETAESLLLRREKPTIPGLTVIYRGEPQPFSRGLLARSILAAGIDIDRAYGLVNQLEDQLRQEGTLSLTSDEVARRISVLLERQERPGAVRRYRLVRRIRRLPRPLVIYIGGASGTGKSTLALELAPLLRIYRVTATDTVRQVMRMLFSPQILPSIHGSSFEQPETRFETLFDENAQEPEGDPEQRVITSFVEQATRVGVGVRAVVERAITENMSILVEGVHLVPPLVPFPELGGACYQVPLVLGTADEESHRSRFTSRFRGSRMADRYMESFRAIRGIHDFVLDQAEAEDVPYIDTSTGDPVGRALRQMARLLEQQIPDLVDDEREPQPPTLLLIIDGLADRPVRALGGRTPLQAAHTPNLDRLAREGRCGLADPVAPGVVPDTAAGSLALFGQLPTSLARGPVEALGAGLRLRPSDVALRGNFATLDAYGQVVDRRAGRIRDEAEELAEALDRLPLPGIRPQDVEVRVVAATEHRLAVVLRGDGLGAGIRGSDPGDGAIPCPPLPPAPIDPLDERAVLAANALAIFEQEAREVLAGHEINRERIEKGLPPANTILTRGAGRIHELVPVEVGGTPLGITCIAGDRTILGLAGWLGAEQIMLPGMTANLDTDLELKFEQVAEALLEQDLVVLHLKGADIAAHDGRPEQKADFIARVDEHLGHLLERHEGPLRIAVGGDHATLSESGQHSADPLPVLIWGDGITPDEIEVYDETSVAQGALQRFPLQMLLDRVLNPV